VRRGSRNNKGLKGFFTHGTWEGPDRSAGGEGDGTDPDADRHQLARRLLLWDWLRGRRGLPRQIGAIAIYGFAVLVIVAAATGPSSSTKSSSSNETPPKKVATGQATTAQPSPTVTTPKAAEPRPAHTRKKKTGRAPTPAPVALPADYGGLGATVAAFRSHNNTQAPAQPLPGVATYTIDTTNSAGLVTAYSVQITARPPMGNGLRMFLTEGINLPDDATSVRRTSTCELFRSATLSRLLGKPYARASTTTGTDTAHMEAVADPSC
jgi:hypothetical protein